ncbi:beta-1,3-glucosyltransferase [Fopius arisanus]|uniref:Beta-1,3-glucosyltransferase n=1 Tax=Fopius arisanus TaxID=64838 RepID=A0A9R1TGJ3_9HYME|nr:PREDICTED: beta-1,3-glucosyltransferase [Fopius arisanus]
MGNSQHLLVFLWIFRVIASDASDLVITVLSQRNEYSATQSELLKEDIIGQAHDLQRTPPRFLLTHEKNGREAIRGGWTIYPLVPILYSKFPDAKWYFFCVENTAVKLEILTNVLSRFNSSEPVWLGHALHDAEATIIHHFVSPRKVSYPNLVSGFVISRVLMKEIRGRIHSGLPSANDFIIDETYEFSNFVMNTGKGQRLIHQSEFCVTPTSRCATYPKKFPECGNPVPVKNVFFAVKTYNKNHASRIPVLMKTWLRKTQHYALFSNKKDTDLENIILVPHTTEGHCLKTYGLLQNSEKLMKEKNIEWLIIADDDTLLSVDRLMRLLSCYNEKTPMAIGERYGFRSTEEIGYDYLTGGAGVVLSLPLVQRILSSIGCRCPLPTTPDDMFLFGICLSRLGIPALHAPFFHQARPQDYPEDFLASHQPVSFHKFWMIDPVDVYRHWFDGMSDKIHHTELR